jgi:hypothetical protein
VATVQPTIRVLAATTISETYFMFASFCCIAEPTERRRGGLPERGP